MKGRDLVSNRANSVSSAIVRSVLLLAAFGYGLVVFMEYRRTGKWNFDIFSPTGDQVSNSGLD